VTSNRPTVEELARDTLDVRELNRAGLLTEDWITLRPSLRWPRIATMRLARYRILLELRTHPRSRGECQGGAPRCDGQQFGEGAELSERTKGLATELIQGPEVTARR